MDGLVATDNAGARRVIATEQPSSLNYLEANLSVNQAHVSPQIVEARPLYWGHPSHVKDMLTRVGPEGVDLIVGCEITYNKDLYTPLINTLISLARPGTKALIAHNHESTPSSATNVQMFKAMALQHFTVEQIDPHPYYSNCPSTIIFLQLQKRDREYVT